MSEFGKRRPAARSFHPLAAARTRNRTLEMPVRCLPRKTLTCQATQVIK